MAPPADLRKIGLEGFALIDKYYGRQARWVGQVPHDEIEQPAIYSRDVAPHQGGVILSYTTKPKSQGRYVRQFKY